MTLRRNIVRRLSGKTAKQYDALASTLQRGIDAAGITGGAIVEDGGVFIAIAPADAAKLVAWIINAPTAEARNGRE